MTVKKHYDEHLGNFYSWMLGDFDPKKTEFLEFCKKQKLQPTILPAHAIDLGAGSGIQSVPLAELGYQVTAIDFNKQLIDELEANKKDLPIEVVNDDIRNLKNYVRENTVLILCCGDTVSHLASVDEITQLLHDAYTSLGKEGKILLSFRDYSFELTDTSRFIPVKSDPERILTCFLEYLDNKVWVTDILHEKVENAWQQKISSYEKVRISKQVIQDILLKLNFTIEYSESINRMEYIIATKK